MRVLVGMWLVLGMGACTYVFQTERVQCESDGDCVELGLDGTTCAMDGVCRSNAPETEPTGWECLGTLEASEETPGATHTFEIQIVEVNSQQPPVDLTVMLCSVLDVDCDADPLPVDAEGNVAATVQSGFEGYLDIQSPDTKPALLFLGQPVTRDVVAQKLQLITEANFKAIASLSGQQIDPERGHVIARVVNCESEPAEGVSLAINHDDPAVTGFYLVNMLPDSEAPHTDAAGNGGFINVPTGLATVTGTRHEDNTYVGQTRFQVRPGAISYIPREPTP